MYMIDDSGYIEFTSQDGTVHRVPGKLQYHSGALSPTTTTGQPAQQIEWTGQTYGVISADGRAVAVWTAVNVGKDGSITSAEVKLTNGAKVSMHEDAEAVFKAQHEQINLLKAALLQIGDEFPECKEHVEKAIGFCDV